MSLTPGSRIGPYDVSAQIGEGGMGQVFRATDTRLRRDVALKTLPASVATDPERLARFRREAQLLASLNHPNIAHVYRLEQSGDVLAIAMELVEGPTLADLVAGQRHSATGAVPPSRPVSAGGNAAGTGTGSLRALSLDDTLNVARQLAEALEFAHEHGIIHRDLKPANIKVRPDGTVKVLDFGLAKALTGGDDPASSSAAEAMNSPTLTARSTQLGVILGTAAYMSPEQAKGKPVDRRADIWAFGVILFEMLSGRRGYDAEDISETLAAVLTREVDWAALPADTPPRLRALVRDCLARDPKQRLRDIGEARRVLDQIALGTADVAGSTAPAVAASTTPPLVRGRALPWLVAAAAVLMAAAALWLNLRSSTAPAASVVTRSRVPLTDLAGFVELSHDGRQLAYTLTGGTQGFVLVLRGMDQFTGATLPGSDGGLFPTFSPRGDWIAFSSFSPPVKIKKIPTSGGAASELCEGNFTNGADWGEDDTIVFSGAKGIMRVPASGGTPQALTTVDTAKGETAHVRPRFLPDGHHLLFTVISKANGPQFAVLDLQKDGYRIVAPGGDNGRYVPSGHLTYVHDGTMFAVPFDIKTLAVNGSTAPVIDAVSSIGPTGTADYAFSSNGLLVYSESASQQGSVLSWADRKGATAAIPGQVPRRWGTGRLSPDGLRVANAILTEKSADIWVVDLGRGTPSRLTFDANADLPIWTPDNTHIVYGGTKDGKPGIFSVAADGSSQPQLVLTTETPATPTSFSPDGQTMVFTQVVGGRGRIMVLPPAPAAGATRQPHPLRDTNASESDGTVSPDGKWVAFASTESGTPEIYLLPFPGAGAKIRVSTQGGRSPRWSRNSRELFFWTPSPGNAGLMSVTITPGPTPAVSVPVELFRYFSGSTWDVAPDGAHFLVEALSAPGTASQFVTVTNWFDELRRKAPAKQ